MGKRSKQPVTEIQGRERNLIDFLHNPVFFRLTHEIEARQLHLYFQNLDKQILRKYSLMGAIMGGALVAESKQNDDFTLFLLEELTLGDSLSPEAALIVAEIAINRTYAEMDTLRICREFYDVSEPNERVYLIEKLLKLFMRIPKQKAELLDYFHGVAAILKVPHSIIEKHLETLNAQSEISATRERLTSPERTR